MKWVFFIVLIPNALWAQKSLHLIAKGLDNYPSVVAYEVLDERGISLVADFIEVKQQDAPFVIQGNFPERIAIQAYEDANNNRKMDRGFFGQPTEKYAFSNSAWSFLSKPNLDEQLITLGKGDTVVLQFKWVSEP